MEIERVNAVLTRTIAAMQAKELEDLAERMAEETIDEADHYVGAGGTDSPDHAPDGDAEEGGEGGVENFSHEAEMFLSYIGDVAGDIAGKLGIEEDVVLESFVELAAECAEAGELPPMPDVDIASAEDLAAWVGAAKTLGFSGRLMERLQSRVPEGDLDSGGTVEPPPQER